VAYSADSRKTAPRSSERALIVVDRLAVQRVDGENSAHPPSEALLAHEFSGDRPYQQTGDPVEQDVDEVISPGHVAVQGVVDGVRNQEDGPVHRRGLAGKRGRVGEKLGYVGQ